MINQLKMALYLSIALAVLAGGGFGYYYYEASGTIKERNSTIIAQKQQIDSENTQITTLNSQVASLQGNITAANTQISLLTSQLSSVNTQVTTTQSSLTSANSQIANLQTQLTAASTQITDLTTQNTNLQSINSLSLATVVASGYTVGQPASQETAVAYFTAGYAGYIIVSGYSSSTTGYIRATDTFTSYPYSSTPVAFGTGTSLYIPVLPGTVSVYFGNTEASSAVTGSISLTYYY